jgi:plasmid stabilization system protein ParE
MVKKVIWPARAQKQLAQAYEYILESSPQNAQKIKEAILTSTRKLPAHPEKHPPDKYRKNNDKSFRAYELHRLRIAYRVTEKEIIIVRVRHTKMEPKSY